MITPKSKPPFDMSIKRLDGYLIRIAEEEDRLRVTVASPDGAWTGLADHIDAALELMTRIIFEHPLS